MKLSSKLILKDVPDLKGKRIFIRVDFNVPMDNGVITNDQRIVGALPTIKHCMAAGGKVILASHLGRPAGQKVPKASLQPVAKRLSELLENEVKFLPDCVGEEVSKAVAGMKDGDVVLLENLRFHIEEEGKGSNAEGKSVKADKEAVKKFREALTSIADVYVNDAFGTAHRAHSSMVGVAVEKRVAGLLMEKELSFFAKALEDPQRPFLAILGGAKVSDKILLVKNLLDKVDEIIIGGGMAYTFKKAEGFKIGKSMCQEDFIPKVKELLELAKEKKVKLHFPVDYICADDFKNDCNITAASDEDGGIPDDLDSLDIGPKSREHFKEVIARSKTLIWNGPMGVFEFENFSNGSKAVMDAVVQATKVGTVTIIGGGDTATCCKKWGTEDKVSHVSTGGGASIELLEGKDMPGVVALTDRQ